MSAASLPRRLARKAAYWLRNANPRRFHALERWCTPALAPAAGGAVAVFNHFEADGSVPAHVLWHLAQWRAAGFALVFITTSAQLQPESLARLQSLCWLVLRRRNVGMDIGGWPTAVQAIEQAAGQPLAAFGRLLLTNDSVFGPLQPIGAWMPPMAARGLDLWGITDSQERGHHLQSYFLVLETPAALAFFRRWALRMKLIDDREAVIARYELGLSQEASAAGLRWAALVEGAALLAQARAAGELPPALADHLARRPGQFNPTHALWRAAVAHAGSPYLKRDLLRRFRASPAEFAAARALVVSAAPAYPVGLLDDYFGDGGAAASEPSSPRQATR